MSKFSDLGHRLYSGEVSVGFVSRRKLWYGISIVLMVVSIASIAIRGMNLGIEFRGGAEFTVPRAACTVEDARTATSAVTSAQAIITVTASGTLRVQTETLDQETTRQVAGALAEACDVPTSDIQTQSVGPTWGTEISKKALQGLAVFLVLLTIFLCIYFEWRLAVAALIALAHDVLITVGIYALTGLHVSPATIIGFLTILGYSVYDTVVVFDKIRENTRGITGQSVTTYAEAANLAVNQTLVRSINTSIVALLPVVSIIVVGAGLLGAGTLLDLAVALAIGMAVGAYSSVFVAPTLAVQIKDRQPELKALEARVAARRKGGRVGPKATVATGDGEADGQAAPSTQPSTSTRVAPGVRQQPRRQPRSKRGQ